MGREGKTQEKTDILDQALGHARSGQEIILSTIDNILTISSGSEQGQYGP